MNKIDTQHNMSEQKTNNTETVKNEKEENKRFIPIPSPKEIMRQLDDYVIGQEDAKKTLSVAVHNHYRRIQALFSPNPNSRYKEVELEKSNVLLLGGSGTGKTLMAKTLARTMGVPFAIADATTLTQAGYVGEDVENIIRYLWQNANGNVAATQVGIIYIDEIDKIASKTNNVSISRDVSGEGVQQSLLKIVEGTVCRFPPNGGRKHPDQELVEIDTSNILFICGGAFVGLEDIIKQRMNKKIIGFKTMKESTESETNEYLNNAAPEDLIMYGLIPEFIGRLPIITSTKELDEHQLVRIMTEPKNALVKQYQKLFELDGMDLSFTDEALVEIAKKALTRNTGARGLRAEVEKLMRDVMFEQTDEILNKSIVIDGKFVADAFKVAA